MIKKDVECIFFFLFKKKIFKLHAKSIPWRRVKPYGVLDRH